MNVIKLSENVSVISAPTNVGVIALPEQGKTTIYLIDCGSSDEDGMQIYDYLCSAYNDFKIAAVILTHAHYDHEGGLPYLTAKTGCGGWICKDEAFFAEHPVTIAQMAWGGAEPKELRTLYSTPKKIVRTFKPDETIRLSPADSEKNVSLKVVLLDGHSSAQTGLMITDSDGKKSFFVGDAVSGRNSLKRYWIQFMLDEHKAKETTAKLSSVQADYYVPSHGDYVTEIEGLAELNLLAMLETEQLILKILKTPMCFDDILTAVLNENGIKMNLTRYAFMSGPIRSYVTSLYEDNKIEPVTIDNKLCWKVVD